VAEREATRLCAEGALAVAATGSLGRGDAQPGSDIDLWVIAASNRREYFERELVPVTIIQETIAHAFSIANLMVVECLDIQILYDPSRIFSRLQTLYRSRQKQIQRAIIEALNAEIDALLAASTQATSIQTLLLLREACSRKVLVLLYAKIGLRTPKWRHLQKHLAAGLLKSHRAVLGLESSAISKAQRAFASLSQKKHGNALAKFKAHLVEEAIELARLHVRFDTTKSKHSVEQLLKLGAHIERSKPRQREHWNTLFGLPTARKLDSSILAAREHFDQIKIPPRAST
jgi:predicted nucleotidyltransferase